MSKRTEAIEILLIVLLLGSIVNMITSQHLIRNLKEKVEVCKGRGDINFKYFKNNS